MITFLDSVSTLDTLPNPEDVNLDDSLNKSFPEEDEVNLESQEGMQLKWLAQSSE